MLFLGEEGFGAYRTILGVEEEGAKFGFGGRGKENLQDAAEGMDGFNCAEVAGHDWDPLVFWMDGQAES
jgi:hypothetical protein